MVVAFESPAQQPGTLDITLRGRTYPLSCRRLSVPVPEPHTSAASPTDGLRRRIMSMLSFPGRSPDEFAGNADVVRAFGTDMVLLETMSRQWRSFLTTLKKSNLQATFAAKVPENERLKAIDKALATMGHESQIMVDDDGILNSGLIEQPRTVVHKTLQATLGKSVDRFIRVMRQDLEQLGDLRVVGLLEWSGESACRFHFYEHEVNATLDHDRRKAQEFTVHRQGRAPKMGSEILRSLHGRHIHRVTRYEELLIDAAIRDVSDPNLILPSRVRQLVGQCPAWVRPDLAVVEGEKCREERVELVRLETEWEVAWTEQRIMPHFDPALTLFGEFVLTGWDDEAHEHEIRSRLKDSQQRLQNQPIDSSPRPMSRLMRQTIVAGVVGLATITLVMCIRPTFILLVLLIASGTLTVAERFFRTVGSSDGKVTRKQQNLLGLLWIYAHLSSGALIALTIRYDVRFLLLLIANSAFVCSLAHRIYRNMVPNNIVIPASKATGRS